MGTGEHEASGKSALPVCGCQSPMTVVRTPGAVTKPWTDGVVQTAVGPVPRVRTMLARSDRLGTLRVRSGIGRMDYRVPPGLYAVGHPNAESVVLVSANYKLSFDRLRSVLGGRDAWILVVDTHGINVWCAAGKGTFSSAEVALRVMTTGLARIVTHRRLIVPQLAATGVSAHEVRRSCGFSVVYGPVRADDLPAFLDARLKATDDMRRVRFGLRDRAVLIPVEVVGGGKFALLVAAVFLLLGGLNSHGYSTVAVQATGVRSAGLVLAAFLAGTTLGPLLLPWLPGRPFAVKGAVLGLALVAFLAPVWVGSWLHAAAWALMVPTITSFAVMTFTGSSTFTSLSGVLREMRYAVPAQIAAGSVGAVLWIAGLFA